MTRYPNLMDIGLVGKSLTIETYNGLISGKLLAYEHRAPHVRLYVVETKNGRAVVNTRHVKSVFIHDGSEIKDMGMFVDKNGDPVENDKGQGLWYIDYEP